MKKEEIIFRLNNYIILGLKIVIPIVIAFFIGYFLIYKKLLKGTKTIKKKQILLWAVSIFYVVIVIGATFLSRMPMETYNDKLNLNLFSSYREAYHDIGVVLLNNVLLRNLILNIILFIPLGFLLPMYSDKLKKMYIVVPIGLLTTLTIEFTQHFNDYGTFEIDDAFNNTLGTLIGYCIFMIFYRLKNKENWKKVIGYTTPIIATIALFTGMLISHKVQEFGNFDFENNYTINMSNVNVQSEIEFSGERSKKGVYQTEILTREQARQIAIDKLATIGETLDDTQTTEQENMIMFRNYRKTLEENSARVHIEYVGGKVTLGCGSDVYIDEDGEVRFKSRMKNASREEVEQALLKVGFEVPKDAEFGENRMKQYTFSINMVEQGNKLLDGEIRCNYFEDKTVAYVSNEIITYNKVTEKEIMSEQEAYEEILAGEFKAFTIDTVKSIMVKNIQLEYRLDSKGFYVPIYSFEILLNGKENHIYIKAIR